LGNRLETAGAQGDDWRDYLEWESLEEELQSDDPDLTVLDEIYLQFDAGHHGLGLVWFEDVRSALRRYLVTARAIDSRQTQAQFETLLDQFPQYLAGYQASPSPEGAFAISAFLRWFEDAGQAGPLIRTIRRRWLRPNLFVEISAPVVVTGINRPVDQTLPVRDVILGADVYGTGRTTGGVAAKLLRGEDHVQMVMALEGTNHATAAGYKGPARVYNTSTAQLVGRTRIMMDADGVRVLPSTSEAFVNTRITGVGSRRGCRLVEWLACRRAWAQKSEAECIAAQHAERDLNQRMDEEAGKAVRRANDALRKKLFRPLEERRLSLQSLKLSSTEEAVHITALRARPFELAAPNPPPAGIASPDLCVRVHESMVNNMAAEAASGMVVDDRQMRYEIKQLLGKVPAALKSEDDKPWGITFADERRHGQQPIQVAFADNRFRLSVRGRAYARADKSYPGKMSVTATYRIEQTPEGPIAVRDGDLEVFPPGFDPQSGRRLSARQQVLRRLLTRSFEKIFKDRLVPENIELQENWAAAGPLKLEHWETRAGWMVLAWKRVSTVE
jgi:hypothetical protein